MRRRDWEEEDERVTWLKVTSIFGCVFELGLFAANSNTNLRVQLTECEISHPLRIRKHEFVFCSANSRVRIRACIDIEEKVTWLISPNLCERIDSPQNRNIQCHRGVRGSPPGLAGKDRETESPHIIKLCAAGTREGAGNGMKWLSRQLAKDWETFVSL